MGYLKRFIDKFLKCIYFVPEDDFNILCNDPRMDRVLKYWGIKNPGSLSPREKWRFFREIKPGLLALGVDEKMGSK